MKPKILFLAILIILFCKPNSNACTSFMAEENGKVLTAFTPNFGRNTITQLYFIPKFFGNYACILTGAINWQLDGGINEKGLVMFVTEAVIKDTVALNNKKKITAQELGRKILGKCETIDEVIGELNKYNLEYCSGMHIHITDKNGNSIIAWGDEIIHKTRDYLWVTNTNFREPGKDTKLVTHRDLLMSDMFRNAKASIPYFKKVLNTIYQEQDAGGSLYSVIIDVTNMKMYLHHMHDFENPHILDLNKEFKKGGFRIEDLPPKFMPNYSYMEARSRYYENNKFKFKWYPGLPSEVVAAAYYSANRGQQNEVIKFFISKTSKNTPTDIYWGKITGNQSISKIEFVKEEYIDKRNVEVYCIIWYADQKSIWHKTTLVRERSGFFKEKNWKIKI